MALLYLFLGSCLLWRSIHTTAPAPASPALPVLPVCIVYASPAGAATCHLPPSSCSFLKLLKSGTDPRRHGGSLYFAYGGDVTLSQQRYEAVHADPRTASLAPWQRAAPSFFWNRALAQPLLGALRCCWGPCNAVQGLLGAPTGTCGGSGSGGQALWGPSATNVLLFLILTLTASQCPALHFCLTHPRPFSAPSCAPSSPAAPAEAGMHAFVPPAFQGFAGQISEFALAGATGPQQAVTITLIARRSLKRAGCRQWRRGLDPAAAVANFVESEQLVAVDGGAAQASFVQVAGWAGLGWLGGWLGGGAGLAGWLAALVGQQWLSPHIQPHEPPKHPTLASQPPNQHPPYLHSHDTICLTPPAPSPPSPTTPTHSPPHLLSPLQVRGSIPLLWSQAPCLKYKIPILIAPPSRSQPAFEEHARALVKGYKVRRWLSGWV